MTLQGPSNADVLTVPEPASLVLLGTGLAAVAIQLKKKKT
jgi:hypothetical protein